VTIKTKVAKKTGKVEITSVEKEIRKSRKLPGISTWPRSAEGFIEMKGLNGSISPIQKTDYTKYLPKGKAPGRWTPKIDNPQICRAGWHVTLDPNGWVNMTANSYGRAYVCETRGNRATSNFRQQWPGHIVSGESKAAYSQIRLVREVTHEQVNLIVRINRAIWKEAWLGGKGALQGVAV
jgi:hypothetical protein